MNKEAVKRLIIRILIDREISGYDAYKELVTKGIRLRSNYLYMILSEMRDKGLLKARWVENQRGPRKHLYSLSDGGHEEFREQVRDSLSVIMDAFVHANLNAQDLPDHVKVFKGALARFGIQLLIRVPSVMLEESRPRFGNFAEFALKQYYDISDQDRMVSLARVKSLLGESFGKLIEADVRGNLVLYAGEKRIIREPGVVQELPEQTKLPAR